MTIKAVAFDVYDTLAHWPADRVQPIDVQRFLARFKIEISYQAYEAARQSVLFFDSVKRPIHGWMDFLALTFARMEAKVPLDLLPDIANMYERRNQMQLFPDAIEALAAARAAGLTVCSFTTLPQFMLGNCWHDLAPHLHHYFDGAAIGRAKGHPQFYREITKRLAVSPEEILCVGDDVICDCELPSEAGWQPVHLQRGEPVPQSPRAATRFERIHSLTELCAHYAC